MLKTLALFLLLAGAAVIAKSQSDVSNPAGVVITANLDDIEDDGITTIEVKPGVSGLKLNFDKVLTLFGKRLVLGDASLEDAARIELATQSAAVVSFLTSTFNYTNGPPAEQNYKNNTFSFGYNHDNAGNPLVAGEITVGLHVEPKFSQGGGPFQTEIYWGWRKPDGTGYIRPWGMNIAHDTGKVTQFIQGDIYFVRDNGAQWGLWYENGGLDLSYSPSAGITFANNSSGIGWKNTFGDVVVPLYLDDQNRIILGNGYPIVLDGPLNMGSINGVSTIKGAADPGTFMQFSAGGYLSFYSNGVFKADFNPYQGLRLKTLLTFEADNTYDIGRYTSVNMRPRNVYVGTDVDVGGSLKVGGTKVVGNRCAAIPNSNGTPADDTRAINAILVCMRAHGLVAP